MYIFIYLLFNVYMCNSYTYVQNTITTHHFLYILFIQIYTTTTTTTTTSVIYIIHKYNTGISHSTCNNKLTTSLDCI
uniref:Uncharacterized protein n=1 Tax=Panstrongylus lignarius TaxID=156445 RepID=A0A224XT78_9HEMI